MSEAEERTEKLEREYTSLRKQRRALLRQARRQYEEITHLKTQVEDLTDMLKGNSKNEYDSLDIRHTDIEYKKRQRSERILKQTKLLNIAPDSRVTPVDGAK